MGFTALKEVPALPNCKIKLNEDFLKHNYKMEDKKSLGVLIVGLSGAVASTAVAGIELIKSGKADKTGLPLTNLPENLIEGLAIY